MLENFSNEQSLLIAEFLRNKTHIYLTSVTKEFKEMALNWHISLKTIHSEHLAFVVCVDKESYEYLLKHDIFCVYLEGNVASNEKGQDWIENEKNFKLIGLYLLFKSFNVDIIFSDVDIVFLKDPIEKLLKEAEEGWDWLVMSDRKYLPFVGKRNNKLKLTINEDRTELINEGIVEQTMYGEENAGFSFIPNPTAPWRVNNSSLQDKKQKLQFLKNFQSQSECYTKFPKGTEKGCLQTIVNQTVKETSFRVKKLSSFEFPNGSVWKIPYIKNKIKDSCYIVHYNFCNELDPLKVKEEKIARMKENNHWFLT